MSRKPKLPSVQERMARLASFGPLSMSAEHLAQHLSRVDPRTERAIAGKPGSVAVIPVRGVIVPREDRWSQMFGEVGAEDTFRRTAAAISDKTVKAVVWDVDSPGGSTSGVEEVVAQLRALDTDKPIVAHADFLMASAAYHLACGADEIDASPSAMVGWCGVLWPYIDEQKMFEMLGLKAFPFAKPDEKGDGWGMWENTAKFAERRQESVDEAYAKFAQDIATARGVEKSAILKDWAAGFNAPHAKLLGMVDKVRSINETFAAFTTPANTGSTQAARNRLAIAKRKVSHE